MRTLPRAAPLRTGEKYRLALKGTTKRPTMQTSLPFDRCETEGISLDIRYEHTPGGVRRIVRTRGGVERSTDLSTVAPLTDDAWADYDLAWLASRSIPAAADEATPLRIVDLFSGCGGFTLGVSEAGRALGYRTEPVAAVDWDAFQSKTYRRNFPSADVRSGDIGEIFREFGEDLSEVEREVRARWGTVDFLIGGPPCQGHSNLNNRSRRTDERNLLSLKMARAAEILQPRFLIVENVPAMKNDHHRAGERLIECLERCAGGYDSLHIDLKAEEYGVAQTRRRSFIIAWSREAVSLTPTQILANIRAQKTAPRPMEWATKGLIASTDPTDTFNSPPNVSEVTKRRIQVLDELGLTELPDEHRPDCHRTKQHSYGSVYGRMRRNQPAPTLTTGFLTMGRGRFVHPTEPRMITPHEAARIQFFPDFFQFGMDYRVEFVRAIGNAVPPRLGTVIALALLAG